MELDFHQLEGQRKEEDKKEKNVPALLRSSRALAKKPVSMPGSLRIKPWGPPAIACGCSHGIPRGGESPKLP